MRPFPRTLGGIDATFHDFSSHFERKMRQIRITFRATLSAFFLLLIIASVSVAQQSLGDIARQTRKDKPSEPGSRVYTNDDLKPAAIPKSDDDSDKTANASDNSTDKTASTDKSADADKA